ncbi:MAG: phage holin family protein [Burkholderiales bacterium]
MTDGSSRGDGLLASLRGLIRTLIDIAQTRLAILSSDLEEQGACLAKIAIFTVASVLLFLCTLIMAVVFLIMASGEHRLLVVGGLFLVLLVAALWFFATLKRLLADRPKLLAATLAELEKDKVALTGRNEDHR